MRNDPGARTASGRAWAGAHGPGRSGREHGVESEGALSETGGESLQIGPGILAIVLPGLGHAALGKGRRGAYVAIGVLGLFFGGVLIGGVDSIDRRNDTWWFVGQALVGPVAFGVDWANHSLSGNDPSATAGEGWIEASPPSRVRSIAHANEMGMLFATIAGMLNLIAVIDAFWNVPAEARDRRGVVGALEGGRR